MSLVGTRPILQDELQKYELHHRARIIARFYNNEQLILVLRVLGLQVPLSSIIISWQSELFLKRKE